MSDYLRSAFGYLNGGSGTNEYVGQVLELSNVKLRVNRLIAEGGWALVFAVEDIATGKEYALKRLIAVDEEANKSIIKEIETLKKLSGHTNVIQYLCAQRVEREDRRGCEYLIVMELCPGGNLADVLRGTSANSMTLPQICRVAYQITRAVHHMHTQQPQPIIHFDIKLENFLFGSDGLIKLCDFGSSSTQKILPDPSWNAQKRSMLEDQMARFTTPMYRSPEMMDTWNNEPIGPPVDCWALGCILYSLVTLRHPFPEGNKLAIINAKYLVPTPNPRYSCMYDLIKGCLEPSPMKRMTTSILLERLAAIAESNNFDPREPADIEIKAPPPPRPAPPPPVAPVPPRPSPPIVSAPQPISAPSRPVPVYHPPSKVQGAYSAGLFSSLKGGAGSIFRNLKDTSSKVMQTVQQSMARTELDASYLTSRILIMPYPADGIESAYRANHIEDVRAYLQSRHPSPAKIQLYNLSRGRPNASRLPGKHIDCTFAYSSPDSNAPLLSALYQICQDIYRYLDADFNHIVVLYCVDGCRASATVACALLLYAGVLSRPEETITFFTTRRCQPPQLQPSEMRSINYMSILHSGVYPHTRPLALRSLILQPVPLFTRAKDGCRPYVEIYSNGAFVFSTKKLEYEEMKLFDMMEGKVCLIIGDATVRGDVTIVVFHARQQLGRVIGIKIASLHFHTGFISLNESIINFDKKDLDDTPEVGGQFRVMLNIMVGEENLKPSRIPAPWEVEVSRDEDLRPDPLFSSTLEMEETLENFRTTYKSKTPPRRPSPLIMKRELSDENTSEQEIPLHQVEDDDDDNEEKEGKEKQEQEESKIVEPQCDDNLIEAVLLDFGGSSLGELDQNLPSLGLNPKLNIFTSGSSQIQNDIFGNFTAFDNSATNENTQGINKSASSNVFKNSGGSNSSNENYSAEKGGSDFSFDPFGGNSSNDLLGNWGNTVKTSGLKTPNEDNFPRNSSVPNFGAQNKDPFANLAGSLGAGLNASWNGTPRDSNTPQSTSPATVGTPVHSSPHMQNKASMFSDNSNLDSSVYNNKPATKSGDAFEDLLGSQGYNFFSSRKADKDSPKTINEMRKVEAAKTMDPDRLKVSEWSEGKKGNIRGLLCSLHTVLWPEADRWQRYEMHQLVSAADVKKAYRKACLAVHPDKQAGTANENIAKLIFMELNNAWSAFENDASQQNLFS
ncbi:cyclin-G-associated kinase [Microplitis demolitor]|uniref:cyclin-G-associated kinase n=1 Tax=Microplitis demolitor TaxID=69319 RepID=UPI0004CD2E60|nr:cyclin-G-associated kinase [Microplitis demolitor]